MRRTTTSRSASIRKRPARSARVTIPATVDPSGGTPARTVGRRSDVRRRRRQQDLPGQSAGVKWSPRVGAVYSLNTKTVLRGGYGLYWAPWNYPVPSSTTSNYGQIGFTQNTVLPADQRHADRQPVERVPERPGRTARQFAGRAVRRRHDDQLRRSEPHGAARAAVLGRPPARIASARWRSPSAISGRAAITCRSAARSTPWSTSTSSTRSTWRSARRC